MPASRLRTALLPVVFPILAVSCSGVQHTADTGRDDRPTCDLATTRFATPGIPQAYAEIVSVVHQRDATLLLGGPNFVWSDSGARSRLPGFRIGFDGTVSRVSSGAPPFLADTTVHLFAGIANEVMDVTVRPVAGGATSTPGWELVTRRLASARSGEQRVALPDRVRWQRADAVVTNVRIGDSDGAIAVAPRQWKHGTTRILRAWWIGRDGVVGTDTIVAPAGMDVSETGMAARHLGDDVVVVAPVWVRDRSSVLAPLGLAVGRYGRGFGTIRPIPGIPADIAGPLGIDTHRGRVAIAWTGWEKASGTEDRIALYMSVGDTALRAWRHLRIGTIDGMWGGWPKAMFLRDGTLIVATLPSKGRLIIGRLSPRGRLETVQWPSPNWSRGLAIDEPRRGTARLLFNADVARRFPPATLASISIDSRCRLPATPPE